MKALIVEDEKMARDNLARTISSMFPDIEVVGAASSVAETLRWLRDPSCTADIIFMDVELSDGDCFEVTITSEDGIVPASQETERFCEAHGLPPRTGRLIALSVEELAYNIVTYGFSKGRGGYMIEVRVVTDGGRPTLRIRDNCVNFDPVDYLKMHTDDDPAAHIGLRMIMKLVSSANYINTLGLNCLTLTL